MQSARLAAEQGDCASALRYTGQVRAIDEGVAQAMIDDPRYLAVRECLIREQQGTSQRVPAAAPKPVIASDAGVSDAVAGAAP